MNNHLKSRLPRTLREVAESSRSLEDFGRGLREWEHHISREGVHSRPALRQRLEEAPPLLAPLFEGGDIADAYLAALAEWLASRHGLGDIAWTADEDRLAKRAWWAHGAKAMLLAETPSSFRTRHLFTIPNDPFRPRAGRPPVSEEEKRKKQRSRQKRYRERIRKLIDRARSESSSK